MKTHNHECCILGAGPAGLGAALELTRNGVSDILIVDRIHRVGGLARTERFDGSRFDVGPHRFFSKNHEINRLWHGMLGQDFRPINRLTRIYYKDRLFNYPIKTMDTLTKLGVIESLGLLISFSRSTIGKKYEPMNFEEWVIQKFGQKLYETFFKIYTEKVWGIPCDQIGIEWAAQRIKDLDVVQVIKKMLFGSTRKRIRTLADRFDYPLLGAGQMYDAICEAVVSGGVDVKLETAVVKINRKDDVIGSIDIINPSGEQERIIADTFFSSIPMTHFFNMLDYPETEVVMQAARSLYHRDHITVNLLVDGDNLFPDHWVYIHSSELKVARVTNFNNFSREMVGKKNKTALSAEYFSFQHEALWRKDDDKLKRLASQELDNMGLVDRKRVEQAWVVRDTEAYPVYYLGFQEPYNLLKSRLDDFKNIYHIGRGGMYKYNNQDHSMLSGILAARNHLQLDGSPYNLWNINIDAEYHEGAERD